MYRRFWLYISAVNALNNYPGKMPGRQPRIYKANKNFPSKDLYIMTPSEVSFVSKYWLTQCLETNDKGSEHIIKDINSMESYLMESRQESDNKNISLYLGWIPDGKKKSVLYITVSEINCQHPVMWSHLLAIKQCTKKTSEINLRPDIEEIRQNEFDENFVELSEEKFETPPNIDECFLQVKLLIQAPSWNPSQIPSEDLKLSLEDLANRAFGKKLDLSKLYENNARYKLAWNNWDKNLQ